MPEDDKPLGENEFFRLLEQVHGKSEALQRDDRLNQALHTLEATHRRASLAIRAFEVGGQSVGKNQAASLGPGSGEPPIETEAWKTPGFTPAQPGAAPLKLSGQGPPASKKAPVVPMAGEPTHTFAHRPPAAAYSPIEPDDATADEREAPATIYAGRGASFTPSETGHTEVTPRPKK